MHESAINTIKISKQNEFGQSSQISSNCMHFFVLAYLINDPANIASASLSHYGHYKSWIIPDLKDSRVDLN